MKLLLALAALALPLGSPKASPGPRVPILVELFTSEGCSSCPPAEETLKRLARTQPVDGAEVIALGEHVDYWDSGGWRDRFSSRQFTLRQEGYASRIARGRIYTPQAVVAGRIDVIGSDESRLRKAIGESRAEASGAIALTLTGTKEDLLRVEVTSLPPHQGCEVFLALVEEGLVSVVTGGENAGRTLEHAPVVRKLARVGETAVASFGGEQRLSLDPAWKRAALRAIAFAQERNSGRVLAARSLSLQ